MKQILGLGLVLIAGVTMGSSRVEARDQSECKDSWGRAVRSYLTQKRKSGPEDQVFAAACALESEGKKSEARLQAVMLGAQALSKLDLRGCQRFMESYVESTKPKDVCDAAMAGDDAQLKRLLLESMPTRVHR